MYDTGGAKKVCETVDIWKNVLYNMNCVAVKRRGVAQLG